MKKNTDKLNTNTFNKDELSDKIGKMGKKYEILPEIVNFQVALDKDSLYSKDSFKIASDYFRNEVGANINFDFKDRNDIDKNKLDNRLNFAITEIPQQEIITRQYYGDNRAEKMIRNFNGKNLIDDYFFDRDFYDEYHIMKVHWTHSRVNNNTGEIFLTKGKKLYGEEYLYQDNPKKNEKKPGEDYFKEDVGRAIVIMQGIGKLAGLYNTDTYKFQEPNYKLKDAWNIMDKNVHFSQKEDIKFGLIDKQKETLRDYFSGGKTFKMMESSGFDSHKYLVEVGKDEGFWFDERKNRFVLNW